MGNTSDPVSADRPGAKLQRSDSGAAGEKDLAPDLEDMKTGRQARPTVIRWAGGGKEVCITGSFNNWSSKIPMNKSHNDFVAILDPLLYSFTRSCDPALLPEPNHVMLNHLYALSIKDGVMVLSATHRYKKKYVTSLLYKPI
uniref:Association with the SNF1 complex (ASC) domain-containing protein n=1 Tax=Sinocyclocheilus grahami TaxID=75366 RepID=A0A672LDW2_SINGR